MQVTVPKKRVRGLSLAVEDLGHGGPGPISLESDKGSLDNTARSWRSESAYKRLRRHSTGSLVDVLARFVSGFHRSLDTGDGQTQVCAVCQAGHPRVRTASALQEGVACIVCQQTVGSRTIGW